MKISIKKTVLTTGLSVMMMTSAAMAGSSYSKYNTTVGRFNGNGYTGYQKKSISGANGNIRSTNVGGDYVVDVRMSSSSGNGSWVRNLDDKDNRSLSGSSKMKKGCSVRAHFSNDWNTPVSVQVTGSWKSN
ncbi:hypothetical protein [Kandleria vitulina]|uniref:hypothetical protein n=1 Tax=Kandleria vitulina TaxID=1630 RepID=UPI003327E7E3